MIFPLMGEVLVLVDKPAVAVFALGALRASNDEHLLQSFPPALSEIPRISTSILEFSKLVC